MIDDNFTSYLFTFCYVGTVNPDAISVAVEASIRWRVKSRINLSSFDSEREVRLYRFPVVCVVWCVCVCVCVVCGVCGVCGLCVWCVCVVYGACGVCVCVVCVCVVYVCVCVCITTRFKEHLRYIKNNDPQSAYAMHILNSRHEYGPEIKTLQL